MKPTLPKPILPDGRRKLDSLPVVQRRMLDAWLKDDSVSYPTIRERLKKEFGVRASLATISRYFSNVIATRSKTSVNAIVLKVHVSVTRNGKLLARNAYSLPLESFHKSGVLNRRDTLYRLLSLLN